MIITKISIQNYRSIENITLEDIKDINVFIGKNGCGKSHILEALELFFTDLNLMQQTEKGFEENLWFDRDNGVPIIFKIQLELTEKQKGEIFNKDILKLMTLQDNYHLKTNDLTIEREISGNRWNNKNISLGDWELVKNNVVFKEFPVNAFEPNKPANEKNIHDMLEAPIQLLQASPESAQKILNKMTELVGGKFKLIRTTRESGEHASPGNRPFLVDFETRNYLTTIGQNPAREESRKWAKYQSAFRELSSYSLEMRGGAVYVKQGDLYLPLNLLGGGDQEVLILEKLLTDSGVIYGIEEPETHLHAGYQRKLFEKFKEKSKQSQIFVTTHSPIFVDRIDFDKSSIWFLTKEKKATKVERVNVNDSQNLKEILLELGIRMSDVFFADRLLFVEGSTEKEIIPLIAEKLKVDLNRQGVEIIAMRGKDTGKYHIKMWYHIAKNAQLPVFYLFDGDATKVIDKAREEGFLTDDNCYMLEASDIEDLYPEDITQRVVKSMVSSIEIEKEDLSPPRKKKLDRIFEKNSIKDWKVPLGKKVIAEMDKEQIKEVMGEIKVVFDKLLK